LTPPPPPKKPLDWESLISVRAFAWLGGAALFLAMGLFLQYSIQHNLISPAARVAIGLLVGAGALAGGDALRKKGDWAGQATAGAGVAILYASLFAAHARYDLLGTTATFVGMALVTLTAGVLAVRRQSFIVAVLGLAGGFLTPYLLATNEDHPIALFVYVLFLDFGAIAAARRRRWVSLVFLALVASAVLYGGWAHEHLDAVKAPYAMIAAALLAMLFCSLAPQKGGEAGDSGDRADPTARETSQLVSIAAAGGVFFVPLLFSLWTGLDVRPTFLVGYLVFLAIGAFIVSGSAGFLPLSPIAAAFSTATLVARVAPDLAAARHENLALFAIPPLVYLALALAFGNRRNESADRLAAGIALSGGVLVMARFLEAGSAAPLTPLWIFAAVHAVGLLAIGTRLSRGGWILGSQGLLFFSLLVLATVFKQERLSEFLPFVLAPAAVFWALPFLGWHWRSDRLAWLSSAAAPLVHYPMLYIFAKSEWGSNVLGLVAVVFSIAALAALRASSRLLAAAEDRRFTAAIFGAVTLAFVTAAIPILLDKEWITVAWALEAAALAWLRGRIAEDGLVKASTVLAIATFLRLIANPALWHYHARSGTPIVNWYLYTFGIPAAAFLVTAYLLAANDWAKRNRLPGLLRAAAGILLFVLVNIEIADFFSEGEALRFRLSGGGLGEDMTYSLAWGIFALILLALGITRTSRAMRAAALVVLLMTIGKVFLHDLWDLGALYRVGSILGLAVALLAVSFLTQRFVFAKERP
jgi:uncharacterized membrane protein